MFYSAGEVDRSKSVPDLVRGEFERFHALQKNYGADYADQGFFQERTVHSVVEPYLRNLGSVAILKNLAVREGTRAVFPGFHMEEVSIPVNYRRADPIVVAALVGKITQMEEHPSLIVRTEKEYDELVQVGIGVQFPNRGIVHGGYTINLRSILRGGENELSIIRMKFQGPSPRDVIQGKIVRDVPDDTMKDFLQIFREAAWESVSEPA